MRHPSRMPLTGVALGSLPAHNVTSASAGKAERKAIDAPRPMKLSVRSLKMSGHAEDAYWSAVCREVVVVGG